MPIQNIEPLNHTSLQITAKTPLTTQEAYLDQWVTAIDEINNQHPLSVEQESVKQTYLDGCKKVFDVYQPQTTRLNKLKDTLSPSNYFTRMDLLQCAQNSELNKKSVAFTRLNKTIADNLEKTQKKIDQGKYSKDQAVQSSIETRIEQQEKEKNTPNIQDQDIHNSSEILASLQPADNPENTPVVSDMQSIPSPQVQQEDAFSDWEIQDHEDQASLDSWANEASDADTNASGYTDHEDNSTMISVSRNDISNNQRDSDDDTLSDMNMRDSDDAISDITDEDWEMETRSAIDENDESVIEDLSFIRDGNIPEVTGVDAEILNEQAEDITPRDAMHEFDDRMSADFPKMSIQQKGQSSRSQIYTHSEIHSTEATEHERRNFEESQNNHNNSEVNHNVNNS